MAKRMECLGIYDINEIMDYDKINISYESEYGSIEFWEEVEPVKVEDMEKDTVIISPYMKLWIFPPKEFLRYEFKKAMEKGSFPGPPNEREDETGPSEKEKQEIKKDEGFMRKLRKITDKYGGSLEASVQLKDYETGEMVFNINVNINPEDILYMKPSFPEEGKEVTATVNFEDVYELVLFVERDMKEVHKETPPWIDDKKTAGETINEVINGIKIFFKVRSLINSAEYNPESAERDVKSLVRSFVWMMMTKNKDKDPPQDLTEEEKEKLKEMQGELFGSKETITGEVISN
ncbi:hypothetical protein GF386_02215 [Candidatus Pacearchaeota archaeon]|nr:hypothetical protein [Candidatus Pacearchaeota archaeon]MBD3282983.1 hypothetical protein [Candidatus Pacearchaeota archaeon]